MQKVDSHLGLTIWRHGRQYRFKWEGHWLNGPDVGSCKKLIASLVAQRDEGRRAAMAVAQVRGLGKGHVTVAELVEAWWADKTGPGSEEPIRGRTRRDYRRCIDKFIVPLIGTMDASTITSNDLRREFFRPVTAQTRQYARFSRTVLRQSFRWGIIEERLARSDNPCVDVRLTRRNAQDGRNRSSYSVRRVTDRDLPSGEEIQKMLLWASETGRRQWWLFVLLTSTFGLRPSECIALRAEDLDPARRLLHLRRSAPDRSDPDDWALKTETSERSFEIPEDLWVAIEPHLPTAGGDDWLFPARARGGGRPQRTHTATPCWPTDAPNREFRRMREALGLRPQLHPYSLRHYRATRLILEGANEVQVAKYLGTSVEMLQKVYANYLDRDSQAMLALLSAADILSGGAVG